MKLRNIIFALYVISINVISLIFFILNRKKYDNFMFFYAFLFCVIVSLTLLFYLGHIIIEIYLLCNRKYFKKINGLHDYKLECSQNNIDIVCYKTFGMFYGIEINGSDRKDIFVFKMIWKLNELKTRWFTDETDKLLITDSFSSYDSL